MIALFWLLLTLSVSPFKSKNGLAAENAALRHQLIVLQPTPPAHVATAGVGWRPLQVFRKYPGRKKPILNAS
jgi:hypothetical protein